MDLPKRKKFAKEILWGKFSHLSEPSLFCKLRIRSRIKIGRDEMRQGKAPMRIRPKRDRKRGDSSGPTQEQKKAGK